MSRLSLLLIIVLMLGVQMCTVAAPAAAPATGITQPPALYVPQGGKIVTEINISDGDILGLVKNLLGHMSFGSAEEVVQTSAISEAITAVKSVRVIAVQLPKGAEPEATLAGAEGWVAKAGKFTKIVSDTGFVLGQVAVYAQADNTGYVAFSYDAKKNVMYGARLVGALDMSKLLDVASEVGSVVQTLSSPKTPAEPSAVKPTTEQPQ